MGRGAEMASAAPTVDTDIRDEDSDLAACPRCQRIGSLSDVVDACVSLLGLLEACVADLVRHDAQVGMDQLRFAPPAYGHDPPPDTPWSDGFAQWVTWGALRLERRSRRGFQATEELHLTSSQFNLLWVLCAARGAVVSTDELSQALYGRHTGNDHDRVYAHIRRVRRLIEPDTAHATVLVAVRGEGFRLAAVARLPTGAE